MSLTCLSSPFSSRDAHVDKCGDGFLHPFLPALWVSFSRKAEWVVCGCTARSYPNMQPRGSQCIQVGTTPTVCSCPALKTKLIAFPIKKDCTWQFDWQESIASQAVLSPTEVGGHEEGVWGSGLWSGVFIHALFCRDIQPPASGEGHVKQHDLDH